MVLRWLTTCWKQLGTLFSREFQFCYQCPYAGFGVCPWSRIRLVDNHSCHRAVGWWVVSFPKWATHRTLGWSPDPKIIPQIQRIKFEATNGPMDPHLSSFLSMKPSIFRPLDCHSSSHLDGCAKKGLPRDSGPLPSGETQAVKLLGEAWVKHPRLFGSLCSFFHTVDGRNPAPVGNYWEL